MTKKCLIFFIPLFWLFLGISGWLFFKEGHKQQEIHSVQQVIDLLSAEEQAILTVFFQELIFNESGAYTLFGDKPITMTYFLDLNYCSDEQLKFLTEKNAIPFLTTMKRGWSIWDRVQRQLPIKKFCLRRVGDTKSEDVHILFINKQSFIEATNKHIQTFREILSSSITPENLLGEFLENPFPMRDVLKGHTGLLGILFGFGKQNSFCFHQLSEIDKRIHPQNYDRELTIDQKDAVTPQDYSKLVEKKKRLDLELGCFGENDNSSLQLPVFRAIANTAETEELQRKYLAQREHILNLLEKDSFLKCVLSQFSS